MNQLKRIREAIYPLGMIVSKRDGEYRVTFRSCYDGGKAEMTRARQEALASYTSDPDDAIATATHMSNHYQP